MKICRHGCEPDSRACIWAHRLPDQAVLGKFTHRVDGKIARSHILVQPLASFIDILFERLYWRALVDRGELRQRERRRERQQV